MSESIDLYRVLGVRRTASAEAVQKAFRHKSRQTHPDRGGTAEAFAKVHLAWRILGDPEKRARYDATGTIDEEKPDPVRAAAVQLLSATFGEIVFKMLSEGDSRIKQVDLVRMTRTKIEEGKTKFTEALFTGEKAMTSLRDVSGRLTVQQGDSLLASIAQAKIVDIERELVGVRAEIARRDLALKMIEFSQYRCDLSSSYGNSFSSFLSPMEWITSIQSEVQQGRPPRPGDRPCPNPPPSSSSRPPPRSPS